MDLDDRGRQAADRLRRRVEPQIDLHRARAALHAGSTHRAGRQRARVAGASVAALIVIGVMVAISGQGGSGGDGAVKTDSGTNDPGRSAHAAAVLGAMPNGKMDGKSSYKLPVIAQPQDGVSDGDAVTIYGKGFAPNDSLGLVQCSSEADIANAGIGACQLDSPGSAGGISFTAKQRQIVDDYVALLPAGTTWVDRAKPPPPPPDPYADAEPGEYDNGSFPPGFERLSEAYTRAYEAWRAAGGVDSDQFGAVTYADADPDGTVVAKFEVRRFITTPDGGRIDCASGPERCLVGMGAISDYDRSGGTYINFADAPPFPEPALTVDPAGDPAGTFAPGQQVVAKVTSWMPDRQVRLSQCIEDRCQKLVDGRADGDGNADLAVVLQPTLVEDGTGAELECRDRCVLRAEGIGPKGASSAPLPPDIDLRFTAPVPDAPATTVPPTLPPETTAPPLSTTPPTAAPPTAPPPTTTFVDPCNDTPGQGPSASCVPTTSPAPPTPTTVYQCNDTVGPGAAPSCVATTLPGG